LETTAPVEVTCANNSVTLAEEEVVVDTTGCPVKGETLFPPAPLTAVAADAFVAAAAAAGSVRKTIS
jgi:hypothetical protein